MMLLCITIQGDEYLIDCDRYADLEFLHEAIGVDPEDILVIKRFFPKEVHSYEFIK